MISRKLGKQSFAVLDVLPVLGSEFNGHHSTSGYVIYGFVPEFVYKITDSMVVTEDNGRIEAIVECLNCFYEITITEAVERLADFKIGKGIVERIAEDHRSMKCPVGAGR